MNKDKIALEERAQIDVLHADHMTWFKQLDFYKDELVVLTKRLAEVSVKNNSIETRQGVEQFQNRFIREREVIDILEHDIKLHENKIVKEVEENPVAATKSYHECHSGLADRMTTMEKLFADLRVEFNQFLTKWM